VAEHRRPEALPLLVGLAAVVVAALFLLDDTTGLEITAAAAWAFGLAGLGLAGLALALRRLRSDR